ncbi:alpha/beta hydrolase family protein [Kitasatospora sp. NPDC057223]|uniref:alpha/beta hydrolase family protein n=1 Tax=Kitasatospora sp. NPDC057223 TaxID=3346055 RepID=UPI00362D087A
MQTTLSITRSRHDPGTPDTFAPAVLVLPGDVHGGTARTDHAPAVEALTRHGLHTFTLKPPGTPSRHPDLLNHAQYLLDSIRAGHHGGPVDPARVAVLGFGDGGHLAALLAAGPRPPDLCILHGPLISLTHHPDPGRAERILGRHRSGAERRALSAENLVHDRTPPTLLWHPADSTVTPVAHSLRYAQELARCVIDFELHITPTDHPGDAHPGDAHTDWPAVCTRWLTRHGWAPQTAAAPSPARPGPADPRAPRPAQPRAPSG